MKRVINLIKKNKNKNIFWRLVFRLSIKINGLIFRITPLKIILTKIKYKNIFGKNLNLNNPKSLNEKIQWKKFNDKQNIYTLCSDKYLVRNYVKEKIGEEFLIPIFLSTKSLKETDFKNLPNEFIIKASHSSGQNIIIKRGDKLDKQEILNQCKQWSKLNYHDLGGEWQYKNIKPRILVEKLLLDDHKKIPRDYKFHCFNGKVEFIQVDTGRFDNHERSLLDKKWKLLPFTWCKKKNDKPAYGVTKSLSKPRNLKKMIKISEKLAEDFDYVRVDLYSLKNKIYFGELTFTPGGGFEVFFPKKYDNHYGKKLNLRKNKPS